MNTRRYIIGLLTTVAILIGLAFLGVVIMALLPDKQAEPQPDSGVRYTDEPPLQLEARSVPELPPELAAAGLPLHFECTVTNVCNDQRAINRRVTLYYQWTPRLDSKPAAQSWCSTNMPMTSWVGGTDMETTHECFIPPQKAGYLWYYYMVEFDGYCWSGKMKSSDPVTYDYVSPVYGADGVTTSTPPTNAPPSKIYTYRTRFTQVKVPFEE